MITKLGESYLDKAKKKYKQAIAKVEQYRLGRRILNDRTAFLKDKVVIPLVEAIPAAMSNDAGRS